jgi:Na+-translocating ferredoxin:NAD+ oxidoreductase RNF subunit RnfB
MASSGYVAEVDRILCVVCATRKDACPFETIQGDGIAVANWEACIGCGVRVGECPNEAMSLVRDERERSATGRAAISLKTRCALHSSLILYFIPKSLPLPTYKEWAVAGEVNNPFS